MSDEVKVPCIIAKRTAFADDREYVIDLLSNGTLEVWVYNKNYHAIDSASICNGTEDKLREITSFSPADWIDELLMRVST